MKMLPKKSNAKYGVNIIKGIRKFGASHCDLQTMVENVNVLLRVLTLNIDSKNKKGIPIKYYICTALTAGAYFYVFVISAAWFIVYRCLAAGDVIRTIIMFSLCTTSEMGNAKFFYLYYYRVFIRKLIKKILAFEATTIPGSRFSQNLHKVLKKAKFRAILFWCIIMANGTSYVCKSLFTPGRNFMDGIYTIYGLEPMAKSPNFEIGYMLIATSVFFICFVPANVTALLIVCAGYIEAQMVALSEELLHIWPDANQYYQNLNFAELKTGTFIDNNYKRRILNEFVNKKLQGIIRKHAMNVYFIHLLEEVFKGAIALEFMLLMLGLIAELLGGLEKTFLEVPYALAQVAMDCWTGQRVMDASVTFEAAVYACNWEEFDATNMKIVLLMLGSAQKNMKLSAGGVAMLSFTCLMSIVKSVYSTYTALRSRL